MEALSLAKEIGAVEEKPRTINHQIDRSNVPAESDFKRTITIPFIDFILSEMKSRFSENNRFIPVSSILSLIPAIAIDKEPLAANFSIYQDDVPSFSALTSEYINGLFIGDTMLHLEKSLFLKI